MKVVRRAEYAVMGQVLRQAREELGLTQRALSRKLNRSQTFITKIESGAQRVDMVELLDICRVLRISVVVLASRFEEALS